MSVPQLEEVRATAMRMRALREQAEHDDGDIDRLRAPLDLAMFEEMARVMSPEFSLETMPALRQYLGALARQFPDGYTLRELRAWEARVAGTPQAATSRAASLSSETFNFLTSQEVDVLQRAAAHQGRGNWETWDKVEFPKLCFAPKGEPFRVELLENVDAQDMGMKLHALEQLASEQDADFGPTFFYIARQIAPPAPLPARDYAGGWLDLEDIAEKIGWAPSKRSLRERAEMRAKIWRYIVFGARAEVVGQRTGEYVDSAGQKFDTVISSAPWNIVAREWPKDEQGNDIKAGAPLRVEVVIGKQWEPLLTHAKLAQYLPMAEGIKAIPANQVAGEWARVLYLVLPRLWRMRPHEVLAGTLTQPTRRELLTRLPPKGVGVEEVLSGNNPKRAVEYWRDALAILADIGLIAPEAEAARTVEQMLEPFGRQGWKEKWLDERVDLMPGRQMVKVIKERAEAKYEVKPRALGAAKRKPGRPKKKP